MSNGGIAPGYLEHARQALYHTAIHKALFFLFLLRWVSLAFPVGLELALQPRKSASPGLAVLMPQSPELPGWTIRPRY